jgi:hypothetical protein
MHLQVKKPQNPTDLFIRIRWMTMIRLATTDGPCEAEPPPIRFMHLHTSDTNQIATGFPVRDWR